MPDKSRQPTPSRPNLNRGPTPSSPGAAPFRLHSVNLSDIGRARDHQEDSSGIFKPSDPALLARRGELFIVADGMGGHNAGEVASQMALDELQRAYFADPNPDIQASLAQALQAANQAIYQLSRADARQMGMGTTAALAVVHHQQVFVANVGDSRVYLVRGGQISQITHDHSWVEEQVRAGVLTPEQARTHPQRNIITRALGTGPAVEPEFYGGALQIGDVLVLCSDGLTGHVTDAEILLLAGENPPNIAAQRLIELANERGGSDNITVIIVRAEPPAASTPGAAAVAGKGAAAAKGRSPALLFGLIGAALLGLVIVALLVIKPGGGGPVTDATATAAATSTQVLAPSVTVSFTQAVETTATGSETLTLTASPTLPAAATGQATATLAPIPTATPTPRPTATPTRTPTATPLPTPTPVPPTDTPAPPTDTPAPPTDTPAPPTNTPVPPTATLPAGSPAPIQVRGPLPGRTR